jgi:ubiquitin-conjugating enzyme (huntingtin interacting protein 2)
MMLQSLLSSPEPKDPQDAVVAKQYQDHPVQWKITANRLAHKMAGAPLQDYDQGGSGGATNESLRKSQREAKEKKQRDSLAE